MWEAISTASHLDLAQVIGVEHIFWRVYVKG